MFADDLKNKRKSLGLTQVQFAEKIGVSYRTYQDWETAKHKPPEVTRKLILEVLKYM